MSETTKPLTVDEAVAEFMNAGRKRLASLPPTGHSDTRPLSSEEAEAQRFRMAEHLLNQMCPDPRYCANERCRRDGTCRHIIDQRILQKAGARGTLDRRSPGAFALRHAIWLCVNELRTRQK